MIRLDMTNMHVMMLISPFLCKKKHVCPDHHRQSILITHSNIDLTDGWNADVIAILDGAYTPLHI